MFVESGPDEPKSDRFFEFQMLYGSFFDAIHKNAVEIGFREVSFLAIFNRISRFWPGKKIPDI